MHALLEAGSGLQPDRRWHSPLFLKGLLAFFLLVSNTLAQDHPAESPLWNQTMAAAKSRAKSGETSLLVYGDTQTGWFPSVSALAFNPKIPGSAVFVLATPEKLKIQRVVLPKTFPALLRALQHDMPEQEIPDFPRPKGEDFGVFVVELYHQGKTFQWDSETPYQAIRWKLETPIVWPRSIRVVNFWEMYHQHFTADNPGAGQWPYEDPAPEVLAPSLAETKTR